MRVDQLMTRDVRTCRRDDSLQEAARLMWENDCGCAPVVDGDQVVGMITDRDACMAAFLQGTGLSHISVGSAMASVVHCCSPRDPVAKAEALMREHQVRRLPVVDRTGRLVGLISLNDIARMAEHEGIDGTSLSAPEIVSTLAVVSRKRIAAPAVVADGGGD